MGQSWDTCERALQDLLAAFAQRQGHVFFLLVLQQQAFPRFYFMSSADLLDVLSNGNNPARVVHHFPKFFNAIVPCLPSEREFSKKHRFGGRRVKCMTIECIMFSDELNSWISEYTQRLEKAVNQQSKRRGQVILQVP